MILRGGYVMSTVSTDKVVTQCGNCEAKLKVREALIGKRVKCPKCSRSFEAAVFSGKKTPRSSSRPQKTIRFDRFDAEPSSTPPSQSGQLASYPTLPIDQQYAESLKGIPRIYEHEECGQQTGMPEDIVRTYLVDPYFYAYKSYCSGCDKHISMSELRWVDTGETLLEYTRALQAEIPNADKLKNKLITGLMSMSVLAGLLLGVPAGIVGFLISGLSVGLVTLAITTVLFSISTFFGLVQIRGGI